eukprot:CAMPEP_0172632864 /NCGR_PEP_ID=MMETSP1068-20121228/186560_1 /TAXON_ID=35684 /ORGANISM="Pseudopedinella elastica, Strain CCMP716" /LENGTH=41 /DNA_ID= /DNA_START= /DNA_END= /DNA_ORIENTATION=
MGAASGAASAEGFVSGRSGAARVGAGFVSWAETRRTQAGST